MSTSEAAPAPSRWIQSHWYRRAFVAGFVLLIAIKAGQGIFSRKTISPGISISDDRRCRERPT